LPDAPPRPAGEWGTRGAIISGGEGTAESKIAALKDAKVSVTESPATIGEAAARVWTSKRRCRHNSDLEHRR